MPIQKVGKKREPLWKDWDKLAQKDGVRKTVYAVGGNEYTGEWKDNLKHGKGIQVWKRSGARYDGDWCDGKRHGFGMYSIPNKEGDMIKQYADSWKNDMKHGYGTHFYGPNEYYEGEWYADQRSGWGRMYFADGSVYEGEWFNDQRNGKGLLRLANGNRYEGSWKNDMKDGDGKFLYLEKGQVYTGVWRDNVAKSGTLEDFDRDSAPNPPLFPLPECKLVSPDEVLQQARTNLEY